MVGDFNDKTDKGIIPRTFTYLYKKINQKNSSASQNENNLEESKSKYNIYLSFVQIYLESIQDLLDIDSKEIRIREDPEKGVFLEGVQWVKCKSAEECYEVFHSGEINRNTESTKMNAHSSRSHAILILRIENSIKVTDKTKVKTLKQETDRIITRSYLYLVDLAGSERVKKTGATDMRLEEAKKINVSLLALGNVISALSDNKTNHISYRDSKLTRLLQESLGGNSKTSLIVTVSPSDYNRDETISSLFFASRAMKVENKPKVNKSVDYEALCVKLQYDLDKLNDEYAKLKIEYDKVVIELDKIKKSETYLKMKKKAGIDYVEINLDNNSNNNTIIENNENENNDNENISTTNSLPYSERKNKIVFNYDNSEIKKMANNYKAQIKKLEKFYENIMKAKSEEYENFLKKVDNILYDKETEIDKLTEEIKAKNNIIKKQKEDIDDISKERDELQKSVVDLASKVEEQKELLESDKTEKEYKNMIEQLNSTILSLEKKIEEYEEKNIFNNKNLTKEKINDFINNKIILYQNEKNNFLQKSNNIAIKKSQNEIKLKLGRDEAIKSKIIKDKLLNDIINMEKNTYKYNLEEESLNNNIELIENQINFLKNFSIDKIINEKLFNNKSKLQNYNKNDLIISNIFDEIDKSLLSNKISQLENISSKTTEKTFIKNFILFKGENDLNSVIKKASILTNIYRNHITKLDEINKEMDAIINEEEINFSKLNNMRDDIETLVTQTEEINNVIKSNIDKNRQMFNIDNVPIEKCADNLDKQINIISNNFNELIQSYNSMNYNVSQLLSIIEENNCYKKKFITNFSSLIQENVNDNYIKQNSLYKLTNLLLNENIMNNSQKFTSNLEELIRELFLKIFEGINEKDNEISVLNTRINSYIKQIDINIKRSNFSRCQSKGFINFKKNNNIFDDKDNNKNLLNNIKNCIYDIKNENNNIYNEYFIKKNKLNENIFIDIIENFFRQINNLWNIVSDETKISKDNKVIKLYNRISQSTNNLSGLNLSLNMNKINCKSLFRQYFLNVSKFSKVMVDYSINNNDDN